MANELIIDPWTPLDYKETFTQKAVGNQGWMAPTWVGDHHRRLQAYKVFLSYVRNNSRRWLATSGDVDADDIASRREYGDPAVLCEQIRAAVMGKDQEVVVPDEEEAGDTPVTDYLRQWAEDERLWQKMIDGERKAIQEGDALYVLGWNAEKRRPTMKVYDPGFYFPVLSDDVVTEDYPKKIHLAWQYETGVGHERKQYVRRVTWELVEGEAQTLPWNDEPTDWHCLWTDVEWLIGDLQKRTVEDFSESNAKYRTDEEGEIRERDIGLDFIPLVHVPNTVAGEEHYGVSSIAMVLQLFDELQAADTDLGGAAATVGSPPIGVGGASLERDPEGRVITYGPGQVFETGDGRLDVVDTSNSLDALLKYIGALLERMSTNARVPEGWLGRVKASEVPSGITLSLSFSALSSMIDEMRLVRREKYQLLLKFVSRMAMAEGELDVTGDLPLAEVQLGPYMPTDREQAISHVTQLLNAHALSVLTAVQWLVDAGFEIEDAAEEVERIRNENFEAAKELFEATGDNAQVLKYLGLSPVNPAVAPTRVPPNVPPAP